MKTIAAISLLTAFAFAGVAQAGTTDVYLCTAQNFGGTCKTITAGSSCYNVPGDINDQISSLKTGGQYNKCTFYVGGSCTGNSLALEGPHPTLPAAFNDNISAFKCDV